jgi:tetratricopeptide (TPR) repeat protein
MLVIISLSFLVLALVVMLVIIIRKFPALAILDVTNLPGEKEAKFKEEIMQARVKRDLSRWFGIFGRAWLSVTKNLSSFMRSRQSQLKKLKSSYQSNLKLPWLEKQKKINSLLFAAQESLKKEDQAAAEESLVEVVSLDQKNLPAFYQLGNLYATQKKWPEARQTFDYALRLAKQAKAGVDNSEENKASDIYFCLAKIEKEADNLEKALDNMQEAIELEPNSPRYLDLILDLSIMKKDKDLAQSFLDRLASVNPENNKLAEWQDKIDKLS